MFIKQRDFQNVSDDIVDILGTSNVVLFFYRNKKCVTNVALGGIKVYTKIALNSTVIFTKSKR